MNEKDIQEQLSKLERELFMERIKALLSADDNMTIGELKKAIAEEMKHRVARGSWKPNQ